MYEFLRFLSLFLSLCAQLVHINYDRVNGTQKHYTIEAFGESDETISFEHCDIMRNIYIYFVISGN